MQYYLFALLLRSYSLHAHPRCTLQKMSFSSLTQSCSHPRPRRHPESHDGTKRAANSQITQSCSQPRPRRHSGSLDGTSRARNNGNIAAGTSYPMKAALTGLSKVHTLQTQPELHVRPSPKVFGFCPDACCDVLQNKIAAKLYARRLGSDGNKQKLIDRLVASYEQVVYA